VSVSPVTRREVAERAGNCCEYCRTPAAFATGPFAVEHIHPQAAGGSDDPDNLAWSCANCNQHKYTATHAFDLATNTVVPLFHPRQDTWLDHFSWSDDLLTVEGVTPTGRATIRLLQLNRSEAVNLRRVLQVNGLHPAQETGQ
jgi:5-methylcytosine-specific restriction endonuclease McrA